MDNWGNKIKWSLIIGAVLLSGTYLYLLNDSVFAVGGRRDNEEKIVQLEAEVSTLEADYLGELSKISLDYAKSLGFVEAADNASFAVKDRPLGLLVTD